jgi:hypothetical protein
VNEGFEGNATIGMSTTRVCSEAEYFNIEVRVDEVSRGELLQSTNPYCFDL